MDILYDPRNMANIYVRSQGDTNYEICSLLEWNSKNAGKYLDEVIYEQRKENIIGSQLKVRETEAKINLNAEIEAIVAEAQDMSKGLPKKSKREQISRIKENRREERGIMKEVSTETNGTAVSSAKQHSATAKSGTDEELTPRLRMIKAKAEEQLKND